MNDAVLQVFDWIQNASLGDIALVWVGASILVGALFSVACRMERRERVRGLDHGEWY